MSNASTGVSIRLPWPGFFILLRNSKVIIIAIGAPVSFYLRKESEKNSCKMDLYYDSLYV